MFRQREMHFYLLRAVSLGRLTQLHRRPQGEEYPLLTRSGSIFIYNENLSGIRDWNDGLHWEHIGRQTDFFVSREFGKDDGLMRKTLHILVHGGYYNLVS